MSYYYYTILFVSYRVAKILTIMTESHRENKEERKSHPHFFVKCVTPIKKNIGLYQLTKITF